MHRRLRALDAPAAPLHGPWWRRCVDCGEGFVYRLDRQRLCASCSRARLRAGVKLAKHRRRTSQAGGETISIQRLAERDRWRCGLCRQRVGRSLPGSHPRGPTIDHIIPVSEGGPHTWANVQLAHRRCNVDRGIGGHVQLRWAP